jgi:ribokinase
VTPIDGTHPREAPVVVVVGAINIDLVVAAQQLPGPGETVVGARVERHGGGKGANAAVAAARAGATVRLVGAVGADETGISALSELRAHGVAVADVAVLDSEATGVALIVVDPQGENQIAVGAGANAAVTADQVREALHRALATAGCVLVSTEIPAEAIAAAVETATAANVACVLNPAPAVPAVLELLERGPLLTPNANELAQLAEMMRSGSAGQTRGAAVENAGDPAGAGQRGGGRPDRELVAARAREIVARSGAPVVVTLGAEGAIVVTPGSEAEHVPPRPAQVRDTTGAGDTFNGVLATRLAAGDPLRIGVRAANAAAALSVSEVGARDGMPDASAIDVALTAV